MERKIFGIGFHKTGTKSLASALRFLGFSVTGPNGTRDEHIAQNALSMARKLLGQYDAFQDNPWPILFREMDELCPCSKFILTVRNPQAWIKSVARYFGKEATPMREWIYGAGSPVGNEKRFVRRYQQHQEEVLHYFRHRPDDLLVMNITKGDGWACLCSFLNLPKPSTSTSFPHVVPSRNT